VPRQLDVDASGPRPIRPRASVGRRAFRGAPVAVVCLLLAGCGGGGGSGSSTTSAADWASAYCSAAATWVSAFQSARASVRSSNGSTSASDAVQTVVAATNTFTIALQRLGAPSTPDGSAAEATAKNLGNQVQGHVARASAAVQTNNSSVTQGQVATIVKTQATQSIAAVSSATDQLAKGDQALSAAMKTSSDCATLKTELAKEG
jgi:hypothetical protein